MVNLLRRWLSRIRFSLLTMVILSLLTGSLGALWWRWEPWANVAVLRSEKPQTRLTVSKDGSRLLTADNVTDSFPFGGSPTEFTIWDTSSGCRLFKKCEKEARIMDLEFSEDSRWILESTEISRRIQRKIYQSDSGELVTFHHANSQSMVDTIISPNGQYAVLVPQRLSAPNGGNSAKGIRDAPLVYDLETDQIITRFPNDGCQLMPIAFSGDSKWIAFRLLSAEDKVKAIRIYAKDSGSIVFESEDYSWITFLKTKSRILLVRRGKSDVLHWPSGDKVLEFEGEVFTIFRDEKYAISCVKPQSSDGESQRYLFHLQSLEESQDRVALDTDGEFIDGWVLENGKLLSGRWEFGFEVKGWDANTGGKLFAMRGASIVSSDGRLIAVSDGKNVKIIDVESLKALHLIKGHQDELTDMLFFPDSTRLASSSKDGTVRIWQRRRPEYEWGVLVLPELWLSVILFGALVWSVWRDRKVALQVNPN